MVVTLPIIQSASADSTLYSLDTIAANHPNLRVIAIPAIEDGFSASNQAALKIWYESKLAHGIIITSGLYTRKTSGTQQHGVMQWLTMVSKNEVFNIDVLGPGYKFVVSEAGNLSAALLPQTKMWSRTISRAIQ